MAYSSRKWVALSVALLVLTTCYLVLARHEPVVSPVQRVEAVVAPIAVRHALEMPRRIHFTVSADRPEMHVVRSFGSVELRDQGGMGVSGITALNISTLGLDPALQRALLEALNDSPNSARAIVEHDDERIQLLALKVLSEWGHDVGSFGRSLHLHTNEQRASLKPHALDALLTFAERSDPHVVGTVISSLNSKGKFVTKVFLAGMTHDSSNIRAESLRWLSPERQKLTMKQARQVLPVLVEHLTDRDLVVRQYSLSGLQSVVAYCEQNLGGAPIDEVRTNQSKMIKLPVAPASNRWYRDVFPPQLELAQEYQAEWHAWLQEAELLLNAQNGS